MRMSFRSYYSDVPLISHCHTAPSCRRCPCFSFIIVRVCCLLRSPDFLYLKKYRNSYKSSNSFLFRSIISSILSRYSATSFTLSHRSIRPSG